MPKINILLSLIVAVGLFLRLYFVDMVPPALNWDEISHGYNAYSILKTGKDEWGVSFPTIFRAYGDYKLPVYIYSTSLSEAIFGLNAFAVRLPSLLAGVALIIFTFLLTKKFFNPAIALISAFLVAIEPWTFFLSRGAFEANFSAPLIVGGTYFFLEGLKKNKALIFSGLLFGLSVWTYNSARVFVPLFLLSLLIIYKGQLIEIWNKQKTVVLASSLIFAIFIIPMFFQLLRPEGQARFSNLAILNEGAIAHIEQIQNQNPQIKLIVNRYSYFIFEFVKNWISHFSPNFLFFTGGTHYQFSVPNHGLLYIANLPFFLLGLVLLLKDYKKYALLVVWLLLAPIAGSLTRDVPHVLRSVVMLPIPMIITALGLYNFFALLKNKNNKLVPFVMAVYVFLLSYSSFQYLNNYFFVYPKEYSQSWQYGYKEVVEYTKDNQDKYDQIIMTKKYGEPHEFVLFYRNWNPQSYRDDSKLVRYPQSNWFWVDSFDKFYFVNDWEIPKEGDNWVTERKEQIDVSKKTLLITSPENYPPSWNKLETIYFLDGKVALEILEN